jgi:hypothetical protein
MEDKLASQKSSYLAPAPSQVSNQVLENLCLWLEARVGEVEDRMVNQNPLLPECDMEGQLGQFDARLEEIQEQVSGNQASQYDDGSFSDTSEVEDFLHKCGVADLSHFLDAFAVWPLATPKPVMGNELADEVVASSKVDQTPGESDLLASLSYESPPLWFLTTADPHCAKNVDPTKRFRARLPDYASFDENLTCTKKTF